MHPATISAFQDELVKIATSTPGADTMEKEAWAPLQSLKLGLGKMVNRQGTLFGQSHVGTRLGGFADRMAVRGQQMASSGSAGVRADKAAIAQRAAQREADVIARGEARRAAEARNAQLAKMSPAQRIAAQKPPAPAAPPPQAGAPKPPKPPKPPKQQRQNTARPKQPQQQPQQPTQMPPNPGQPGMSTGAKIGLGVAGAGALAGGAYLATRPRPQAAPPPGMAAAMPQ